MTARLATAAILATSLLNLTAHAADLPSRSRPDMPAYAAPAPVAGFYFGTRNGFGVADDTNFAVAGGGVQVSNQYELGFSNGLVLGYNFGPILGGAGFRAELEAGRSQFSIDTHTVNGVEVSSVDSFGELRAFSGLANAFIDFNLGRISGAAPGSFLYRVTPYIGGGIGYSQVELRKLGISATGTLIKDDDAQFAYNFSAGVGIEVFDRTTLEFGYRYMAVPDLQFSARDGTRADTELTANLFTVGMRRQF